MLRSGARPSALLGEDVAARRALDVLDTGVVVLSADLTATLYLNERARALLGEALPRSLFDAVAGYVRARRDARRPPPAMRLEHGGRTLYVRVASDDATPPVEVVVVREELARDVDKFQLLQARYAVSRREFQILMALRAGATNRQIAAEQGLAEGTVARHLHRLLARFGATNRTQLVNVIDELTMRRS